MRGRAIAAWSVGALAALGLFAGGFALGTHPSDEGSAPSATASTAADLVKLTGGAPVVRAPAFAGTIPALARIATRAPASPPSGGGGGVISPTTTPPTTPPTTAPPTKPPTTTTTVIGG
ncbi:MAG: hypothetical protein ABR583_05555 [Gaiellaceae bacterium]